MLMKVKVRQVFLREERHSQPVAPAGWLCIVRATLRFIPGGWCVFFNLRKDAAFGDPCVTVPFEAALSLSVFLLFFVSTHHQLQACAVFSRSS